MSDDSITPAELPQSLTPSQVGKACNMSRRSAKMLLRAAGVAECGQDGRWFVRTERLRELLPDVFDRVVVAGGANRPSEPLQRRPGGRMLGAVTEPKRHFVEAADGRFVELKPERDAALDLLEDVNRFGESLEFDEQGNLISGTPSSGHGKPA